MRLNKNDAGQTLTRLLALRDFRKDLPLQQRIYKQELGQLVVSLRQAVREISDWRGSGFTLTLDLDSTFALFLNDETSTTALTSCYIDTSRSGTIRLSFIPRGLEPRQEDLYLDSPGPQGYQWRAGNILITTFMLHDYVLQRLFEVASEAVESETSDRCPAKLN